MATTTTTLGNILNKETSFWYVSLFLPTFSRFKEREKIGASSVGHGQLDKVY
jgi:hypothetical protein